MNSFSLADCTTVDAALSQLKDGAVIAAGGVDLLWPDEERYDSAVEAREYPQRLLAARNT